MQPAMGLMNFLMFLLMSIPIAIIVAIIAKREGKNEVVWFFIGLIPILNYFILMWMMIVIFLDMVDNIKGIFRLLEEQNLEIRKRKQSG